MGGFDYDRLLIGEAAARAASKATPLLGGSSLVQIVIVKIVFRLIVLI